MKIQISMIVSLLSVGAHAMPMLTWNADNTQVTGATGLEMDGMLFDMEFLGGSCIDSFSGCDENSDFLIAGAGGKTHADLMPVFYDAFISEVIFSDNDSLDANPSLAFGCQARFHCFTLAPIQLVGSVVVDTTWVRNNVVPNDLYDAVTDRLPRLNSGTTEDANWARFTKKAASVPESGTLALLAIGLAGLGMSRKSQAA